MQARKVRVLVWASGSFAFVASTAATVFVILDAVNTAISYPTLTIAAAALDVVALLVLVLTFILRLANWRQQGYSRWRSLTAPLIAAVIGLSAAVLTLIVFILQTIDTRPKSRSNQHSAWVRAGVVVAAASAAAQFCFYAVVLVFRFSVIHEVYMRSQEIIEVARPETPMRSSRVSLTLKKFSPVKPLVLKEEPMSPSFKTNSETSLSSSLQPIIRPKPSKTRLLKSREAQPKDSGLSRSLRNSMDSISQSDAFDHWDTSEVDPQTRDAVFQSSHPNISLRGLPLETIPGSRPASPGRALEGPFPDSSPPVSPITHYDGSSSPLRPGTAERGGSPFMNRPETAYTSYTSRSHTVRSRATDSRAGSTVTLPSRPESPSINEAHIHPLFRSDSPTPPPSASRGTIIHASSLGGQTMPGPPRPFTRSRTASYETLRGKPPSLRTITGGRAASSASIRTASPSPLNHQRSFSREPLAERDSAGSTTPPSRELTPPIPDFILSGVS